MGKSCEQQKKSWDNFWRLEKNKKKTDISWSKKRILRVIAPYIKKNGKVLDAGCGTGFFSKFFCEYGMTTVSLDYSEEALSITRQLTQGQAKIVKADLLSPNLHQEVEGGFDIIFSDGLFEHFSDSDQDVIIRQLVSLLSLEGVLITFVPNRWSPWQIIRPFLMPGIKEKPFTFSSFKKMNQRNELTILSGGGLNTFPFSFSPDKLLGKTFGMLLFVIAKK